MASAGKTPFRPDAQIGEIEWCHWHEASDPATEVDLGSRDAAVRQLRNWRAQGSAMSDMRRIAALHGDKAAIWRATDDEVIGRVADLLASRRIRVVAKPRELMRVVRHSMYAGPGAEAAPAPSPRRAVASSPLAAPVDSLDYAAMAQALRAAAVDGVPFCEVCEKAKAQREREQAAVA